MTDTDPLAALDHGGVEPPTDFELRRFAQEHAHGVAPGKSVLLSDCWMCRLLVRAAGVTLAPLNHPLSRACCDRPGWEHPERATPEPEAGPAQGHLAHQPGDPHVYRIACEVCGKRGYIRVVPERAP